MDSAPVLNGQIVSAADRTRKILWCLRVGLAASISAALANCLLYLDTGDWRLAGLGTSLALCGASLIPAFWLVRNRGQSIAASILIGSVAVGYFFGLVFLSGLTWLLAPGGLLVLTLVAGLCFPGRYRLWLAIGSGFACACALLEIAPPFERYDAASSGLLLFSILAADLGVTCVLAVLLYRAYSHITTIRVRLLSSFLVLALVPSGVITVATILLSLSFSRAQALGQLSSVATLKEAEINSWIGDLRSDLAVALAPNWTRHCAKGLLTGQDPETVCPGGPFALREHFRSFLHFSDSFQDMSLVNFSGEILVSTDTKLEKRRLPEGARHMSGLHEFTAFVEADDPFRDETPHRHVITAMPVAGDGGNIVGMLVGRSAMDRLGDIMSERAGLGKTGETYLVAQDNLLLTQSLFSGYAASRSHVFSPGLARALSERKNTTGLFAGYRGSQVAGIYNWLDGLGVALVAEQEAVEALGPAFAGLGINLAIALAALCLAVFGALHITRSIATPLSELSEAAGRVAAGDLNMTAKIARQDEIGALAASFNLMTAKLRELFQSLEHRIERLKQADRQLKAYTIELEEQISEREQAEKRLAHQAYHDPLTGLPNRALLLDRLGQVVERSKRRDDYLYAVIFMDLDRFKTINDSLGHAAGDMLLIAAARRMEECVRKLDTVSRLGGDEFVIVLEEIASWKEAIRVAKRLRNLMREPFHIEGNEIHIGISSGIVLSPTEYDRPEDLLRNADIALQRAKEAGRGRFKVFHSQMHEQAILQLKMETDLRRASKNEDFTLSYQPIVRLAGQGLAGVEALLRWRDEDGSAIAPSTFIPVAEETGLILPIGIWVMRQACSRMASWRELGLAGQHLFMSVNLSAKQFASSGLVDIVSQALRDSGLPPERLKIEITESAVMDNAHTAINTLKRLKDLGVLISIDDFGTGYSSLNYLQRFPIDFLKIDRSFVGKMAEDAGSFEIVRTIVTLAHGLRLSVIAEGVETADHVAMLRELGCEFAQGYYFSKPLAETDLFGLLEREKSK